LSLDLTNEINFQGTIAVALNTTWGFVLHRFHIDFT